MRPIYFDYAASTPVAPEALGAMRPYLREKFANPGSIHHLGEEAHKALRESRKNVAEFFGVGPAEVIFTSSATEANNLAITGVIREWEVENRSSKTLPHIVTTAIEHESVLEPCRELERRGEARVSYVKVGREGIVSSNDIRKAIRPETVLVSVMYANNEIGTIQPIAEIAEEIKKWKLEIRDSNVLISNSYPLFHVDAVQAVQFLDCNIAKLGVDLLTASSHKIYGPKGAACLIKRKGVPMRPLIFGGGQEFGFRSGTENVPAIVGFAKAFNLLARRRISDAKRIEVLRNRFLHGILSFSEEVIVNGSIDRRLPNNLNLAFVGFPAEVMLVRLDRAGIAVSIGSACASRATEPSHVLRAMGVPRRIAASSIRFSFGRYTTRSEITRALGVIKNILRK